jgi:CDP-glucose 4,6-dehydratase
VEGLVVTDQFWRGRRVFLTGHTGFKGGWLALMLDRLGASVTGYALPPVGEHSMFEAARVDRHTHSVIGDIRDPATLRAAAAESEPEIIMHLAAQALVLTSYEAPVETFSTNVVGTANVLELARTIPSVKAVVVVTSDKVYKNHEWPWPYRENDDLGGRDPYSSSKACTELVAAAYRDSFLASGGVALATARSGNVIGGGDWALNRIVPDFIRAMISGKPLRVRNPASTRPWQHVLDPLGGYLLLARRLLSGEPKANSAWNFGPTPEAVRSVGELAGALVKAWGGGATWLHEAVGQPHEAALLTLDAAKARQQLGWRPCFSFERTIALTTDWYKAFERKDDLESVTIRQIDGYLSDA